MNTIERRGNSKGWALRMSGATSFLSIGVLTGIGLTLVLVALYAGVTSHFVSATVAGVIGVSTLRVAVHFLMKSRGA